MVHSNVLVCMLSRVTEVLLGLLFERSPIGERFENAGVDFLNIMDVVLVRQAVESKHRWS